MPLVSLPAAAWCSRLRCRPADRSTRPERPAARRARRSDTEHADVHPGEELLAFCPAQVLRHGVSPLPLPKTAASLSAAARMRARSRPGLCVSSLFMATAPHIALGRWLGGVRSAAYRWLEAVPFRLGMAVLAGVLALVAGAITAVLMTGGGPAAERSRTVAVGPSPALRSPAAVSRPPRQPVRSRQPGSPASDAGPASDQGAPVAAGVVPLPSARTLPSVSRRARPHRHRVRSAFGPPPRPRPPAPKPKPKPPAPKPKPPAPKPKPKPKPPAHQPKRPAPPTR